MVRAYEMPYGWDDHYDEGHLLLLYPNEARRHPRPETIQEFFHRLSVTRRHNLPGRGAWNWKTWHWEHELESPEAALERIYQEHRQYGETPGEFSERFFMAGAAHNDNDDASFLRRIAWNAETFADPRLKKATATLDITMEEAKRVNLPRSLHLPHASAFRNSLRLNGGEIVVDQDALYRWMAKARGWRMWKSPRYDEHFHYMIEAVDLIKAA